MIFIEVLKNTVIQFLYKEENSQDKNQSDKDKAQEYADDLGKIKPPNKFIQKEIARLRRKNIIQ